MKKYKIILKVIEYIESNNDISIILTSNSVSNEIKKSLFENWLKTISKIKILTTEVNYTDDIFILTIETLFDIEDLNDFLSNKKTSISILDKDNISWEELEEMGYTAIDSNINSSLFYQSNLSINILL